MDIAERLLTGEILADAEKEDYSNNADCTLAIE